METYDFGSIPVSHHHAEPPAKGGLPNPREGIEKAKEKYTGTDISAQRKAWFEFMMRAKGYKPTNSQEEVRPLKASQSRDDKKRKRNDNSTTENVLDLEALNAQTDASKKRRRVSPKWKAPLAVGASLGENLSRLEEANRLVLQWEAILENAQKTQPGVNLSPFERQLEKVRRERDELDETEENLIPIEQLESTKRDKIKERIDILHCAIERNDCPVGEVNIRTAIDAYHDGRIRCWDKWTLIYGGHIVDFSPTYDSFTNDREERLDRYFKEHGEGWLWFEPPLAPKADVEPDHLLAATWAEPGKTANIWGGEAEWKITMGFRRVKTFHSRVDQSKTSEPEVEVVGFRADHIKDDIKDGSQDAPREKKRGSSLKVFPYKPAHTGLTEKEMAKRKWMAHNDPDGPRCFFLMHLDSGASTPCLYESDVYMLNIDPKIYPSQAEVTMSTANGVVRAPVYELRIDVCRHNGESLVGTDPVWPGERPELGGIFPVCVLQGANTEAPKGASKALTPQGLENMKRAGEDISEEALSKRGRSQREVRLSGLLPFQVCYSACAPGMRIWFGEDRRDVLGADRMPGQRRNEKHKGPKAPRRPPIDLSQFGRPKAIAFEHEMDSGQRLIDTDVKGRPGVSVWTVVDGSRVEEYRREPRKMSTQRHRARAESRAAMNKSFEGVFQKLIMRPKVRKDK